MDAERVDFLTRSLAAASSRRRLLDGTASGLLAVVPYRFGGEGTAAKKKRKKKKGHGKKKRGTPAAPPSPPHPVPTCNDDVKNGSEADVDCGGACPRCANGRTCATRADCAGGLCAGGTCQACAVDGDCGDDANGVCRCGPPQTGGSNVCITAMPTGGKVTSCTLCPTGTICVLDDDPGYYGCRNPCGAL
jgi:hypothetical protein